jgi:probable lipoprotein NlpC
MKLTHIIMVSASILLLSNCGIFRKKETSKTRLDNRAVTQIIREARKHVGAPYQFGGTGAQGFDCSGLVTVAYNAAGLKLPRVSADMAEEGREIRRDEVRSGDLVFFITSKTGSRINHVGIVTEVRGAADIRFIHASDSGVREDNLFSKYYQKTFVKATRPL